MLVMRLSETILAIALAWSCLAIVGSYSVPQTDCIGQACNPGLGIKACCPNALCGLKEFPDGLETHVSCKNALEYGVMRLLTIARGRSALALKTSDCCRFAIAENR